MKKIRRTIVFVLRSEQEPSLSLAQFPTHSTIYEIIPATNIPLNLHPRFHLIPIRWSPRWSFHQMMSIINAGLAGGVRLLS
jgi:hypothetical protein